MDWVQSLRVYKFRDLERRKPPFITKPETGLFSNETFTQEKCYFDKSTMTYEEFMVDEAVMVELCCCDLPCPIHYASLESPESFSHEEDDSFARNERTVSLSWIDSLRRYSEPVTKKTTPFRSSMKKAAKTVVQAQRVVKHMKPRSQNYTRKTLDANGANSKVLMFPATPRKSNESWINSLRSYPTSSAGDRGTKGKDKILTQSSRSPEKPLKSKKLEGSLLRKHGHHVTWSNRLQSCPDDETELYKLPASDDQFTMKKQAIFSNSHIGPSQRRSSIPVHSKSLFKSRNQKSKFAKPVKPLGNKCIHPLKEPTRSRTDSKKLSNLTAEVKNLKPSTNPPKVPTKPEDRRLKKTSQRTKEHGMRSLSSGDREPESKSLRTLSLHELAEEEYSLLDQVEQLQEMCCLSREAAHRRRRIQKLRTQAEELKNYLMRDDLDGDLSSSDFEGLLDTDVYPMNRESDPMSQSMYDASTSDQMSQSMYDNGIPDTGSSSKPLNNQLDSLCSNGDAQYVEHGEQGYPPLGGLTNGNEGSSGPVPEGMLIDFGGQNQNPFEPQSKNPFEIPASDLEQVSHTESQVSDTLSQPSEQSSEVPASVDDLINSELAGVSLNQNVNEVKSQTVREVHSTEHTQVIEGGSMEEGGLSDKQEGDALPAETQPMNGDVNDTTGFTKTVTSMVTETTTVNGDVTKVTKMKETTNQIRQETRIPQKPPSPKKSGIPTSALKKETDRDVGPGWDDSISVAPPPRPISAHLLPRNKEPTPPRPMSARQAADRKKYGIDSKRAGYRPGGGDIQIFTEKKEYHAEKRIDSRASSISRASPKPGSPRSPPVNTPSPNFSAAKSKIGSLDKASHTPGGGNVKIVTKKTDYATVGSRVGSKDKIQHKPGGGNVKIENKKLTLDSVGSRIGSLDNARHTPGGGEKKIESKKLSWEARSKVGSMDNAKHVAGGGDKKIEKQKLEWKVDSKIGSMDNAHHKAAGGDKKIEKQKLDWKVDSKIGSMDNAHHKAAGGDKKIETKKLDWKRESKVGSLDNAQHKAGGGERKIETKKLDWKRESRVGSLDNAQHKAGGGEKKIETKKLDWKTESKIGSMDNAQHVAGGGEKKIETKKLDWKVDSKVGSMDNAKHKAGGGDKKIETHKVEWKVGSKVCSLDYAGHVAGGGDVQILDEKVEVKAEARIGSLKNVKHSPGGGERVIESHKLNFKETAKARTKHGLNDDGTSRRSNSITSQSTTDSQ